MNLNDIVQSAQGGQAVDNIAAKFGLSPDQAQGAINALLPALQMGLQNTAQSGGGLQSILAHLGNDTHQQAYTDPNATNSPQVQQQGGSVLGDLFGGQAANSQIAQQVSNESGISPAVIQSMLPIVASIVMGGLFHGTQNSGLGGPLSGMIGSVLGGGGLGSMLGGGQQGQAAQPVDQSGGGGLGGMISSVLGGLFGGGGNDETPAASPATQAAPGVPPSESNAVLDQLSQMFEAGTPSSPEHQANLASIIQGR